MTIMQLEATVPARTLPTQNPRRREPAPAMAPATETPMERRQRWVSRARCREGDADELFVSGAAQNDAARLCRHCPVRRQCLAEALTERVDEGVWGGLTVRQRRLLRKRLPEISDWEGYLRSTGLG